MWAGRVVSIPELTEGADAKQPRTGAVVPQQWQLAALQPTAAQVTQPAEHDIDVGKRDPGGSPIKEGGGGGGGVHINGSLLFR